MPECYSNKRHICKIIPRFSDYMEVEQAVNRKRIVALILAAVMALPSNAYAALAAPGGTDMPLQEETDVQAELSETEDDRTETPALGVEDKTEISAREIISISAFYKNIIQKKITKRQLKKK